MIRKYPFLIPIFIVALLLILAPVCEHLREPLEQRKLDVLRYVKQHDGINASILNHTVYASGGTAWILQPDNDKYVSFVVVDDGYFRTSIENDDYSTLYTRP